MVVDGVSELIGDIETPGVEAQTLEAGMDHPILDSEKVQIRTETEEM